MSTKVHQSTRSKHKLTHILPRSGEVATVNAALKGSGAAECPDDDQTARDALPVDKDCTALRAEDTALRATNESLLRDLQSLKVATQDAALVRLVDDAVVEGKLLPGMREWALMVGRSDPKKIGDYIRSAPTVLASGLPRQQRREEVTGGAPIAAATKVVR